jgi:organic hydroperoxide reductase OsmC/OhrA
MLSFLSLAAKRNLTVTSYRDGAVGEMGKDNKGRDYVATVVLHPEVRFSASDNPAVEDLEALHEAAHEICFIANSVKTEVRCEPRR